MKDRRLRNDSVQVLCRRCGKVVAGMTWHDGQEEVWTVLKPSDRGWQQTPARERPYAWCEKHGAVVVDWAAVVEARRLGKLRRVRFAPGSAQHASGAE